MCSFFKKDGLPVPLPLRCEKGGLRPLSSDLPILAALLRPYLSLSLSLFLSLQFLSFTSTVMLAVSLLGLLSVGNRLADTVAVPAVLKLTSNFTFASPFGPKVTNWPP